MAVFKSMMAGLAPAFSQDMMPVAVLSVTTSGFVMVADNTLSVYGTTTQTFALGNYTMNTLVAALNSAGITANLLSPIMADVSALSLLDAKGTVTTSAPLTLMAGTSPNFLLFKPLSLVLEAAQNFGQAGLVILNIRMAKSIWLDYWGWILGVSRYQNEPDNLYAERIIGLTFGYNVNDIAIENFFEQMGYTTTVTTTGPGQFAVDVTLPTSQSGGFVYSLGQLQDALNTLKASGIVASVNLKGILSDTTTSAESISYSLVSSSWTVDNVTVGQFTV